MNIIYLQYWHYSFNLATNLLKFHLDKKIKCVNLIFCNDGRKKDDETE